MIPPRARLASVFVLLMAALTLLSGLTTPDTVRDVDQIVYENTLHRMQDGEGYYQAMRASLVDKDGLAPTQVRSFRTPLVLEPLSWLPPSSWRIAASVAFAATIGLAAALAHPFGRYGSTTAAVLSGFWAVGYAPLLYLHAEVWALPLALGGLLLARRAGSRVSPGALALLALATVVRELFALLFLLLLVRGLVGRSGLRWDRVRSVPEMAPRLLIGGAAALALWAHAGAAGPHLASVGYEPPFGNEAMRPAFLAAAVGPGDSMLSLLLGVAGVLLGILGLIRVRRCDPVAGVVGGHTLVLLALTLTMGRSYWGYAVGPFFAIYLPAAFARRHPHQAADRAVRATLDRPIGRELREPLSHVAVVPTRTR